MSEAVYRRYRGRSSTTRHPGAAHRRGCPATATPAGGNAPRSAPAAGTRRRLACDGGTPNARRKRAGEHLGRRPALVERHRGHPSPRCSRHAARSSMTRRRSAAGGSPVSRLTSREKWNSEAKLLRAMPADVGVAAVHDRVEQFTEPVTARCIG